MGSSCSKGLTPPAVPCESWGEPLEEKDSLALAHAADLLPGSGTMVLAEGPQPDPAAQGTHSREFPHAEAVALSKGLWPG